MCRWILALLIVFATTLHAVRLNFTIPAESSFNINSDSELTVLFSDYQPVVGDVFTFTVSSDPTSIQFTETSGECRGNSHAQLVVSVDKRTLTLTVGSKRGNAPPQVVCNFGIRTPSTATIASTVTVTYSKQPNTPVTYTLPPFVTFVQLGMYVEDISPDVETRYTFSIPAWLPLAANKPIRFAYDQEYFSFVPSTKYCWDLDDNTHVYAFDDYMRYFIIIVGQTLMKPKDGVYTFTCLMQHPSRLPNPAQRAKIRMSYEKTYFSQHIALPALEPSRLADVQVSYSSPKANTPITLIIVLTGNMRTAAGETIAFSLPNTFRISPTTECRYKVQREAAMHITSVADGFVLHLPDDLSFTALTVQCSGMSAPSHAENRAYAVYDSPYGYGHSDVSFILPALS